MFLVAKGEGKEESLCEGLKSNSKKCWPVQSLQRDTVVWWHWGGTAKESRPCVWGTHSETVAHAHTRGRPSSLHERERESYARDETRDQIPQRPTERAFPLLFVAAARRKFSGRGPQNACETKPGFAKPSSGQPQALTSQSVRLARPAGQPVSRQENAQFVRLTTTVVCLCSPL